MSAPQGSGLVASQQAYYPNPAYYLGQMTSDPSSPSVGQWWYRVDIGQIRMYTSNGIVTLQYQSTEVIASDTTIGGTNVNVTTRLVVLPNVTLTIYGSIMFAQDLIIFGTLLSSNPSASSSAPATNSYNLRGTLYLDGTYTINQYNMDQINYLGGFTYLNQSGSISISGTLVINANVTIQGNPLTISGSGTLNVNSGYTLTINSNTTFGVPTISGAGTLSISSGSTLTQSTDITLLISTINVAGTWANAGYNFTIPSGVTVTWKVTGSVTTASTPGTLTVDGTCYWYGNGVMNGGRLSSDIAMTFFLSLTGSGIFIGAPTYGGTSTKALSLSSTALSPGSNSSSSATSNQNSIHFVLSSVSGSAVGNYTLEVYDSTYKYYHNAALIYIGTANNSYSVSGDFGSSSTGYSNDTMYVRNSQTSVGTITLTGTAYL